MELDKMYTDFKKEVIAMVEHMWNQTKGVPPGFFILVKSDAMAGMVNAKKEISVEGFRKGERIGKLDKISSDTQKKMSGFRDYKDVTISILPLEMFFRASNPEIAQLHKNAANMFIREFIQGLQQQDINAVVCCAFVSEAWTSKITVAEVSKQIKENKGILSPSKDPNRRETVFIQFETKLHEDIWYQEIIRLGEDIAELKALSGIDPFDPTKHTLKSPGARQSECRFAGFLSPPEIMNN